MPTYATPTPVDLAINLQVGQIDVIASDRADSVVTVKPTNPDKASDVRGAAETTVEFDGTTITVKSPKPRFAITGPSESIDITVELPLGSRFTAECAVGGVTSRGPLRATRIKSSMGADDVEAVGTLWLENSHGSVNVGSVDGAAQITASHGQVRVGTIAGDATIKASHGSITVAQTGGELDAKLSYGDLELATALDSVTAKTAYGNLRLGEVSAGAMHLESGFGEITVGVRDGVAAWLDLSSKKGHVRNDLASDSAPAGSEQTVSVLARTSFGNIRVERSA
jgi:hypothetical protein